MTYILRHWKQNRKLTIKIKRDKRENSKRKAVQYLILCTIVDILRDKKTNSTLPKVTLFTAKLSTV